MYMDFLINAIIFVFIAVAIIVTNRYLKRIKNSYKDLKDSLEKASKALVVLYDMPRNKSLAESCNDIFSQYPNLEKAWDKFKSKLDKESMLRALIPPREFFSRDKLIKFSNIKNHDRIKALPGLLTAWGLLGTFIAILLGLKGIDPNNIATINQLVHGLSAKFLSSIVALFCSISFIFPAPGAYSELNDSCNEFQDIMENLFPTISTNEILKSMETNLGKNISENSIESMNRMVEMFRQSLSKGTAEHFQGINEQFKIIHDQFEKINDIIDELNRTLIEIQDSHEDYLDKMDKINTNTAETLAEQEKSIKNMTKTSKTLATSLEGTEKVFLNVDDAVIKMSTVGKQLAANISSLNEQNNSIEELTQSLNRGVEYFNNVTDKMSGINLSDSLDEFREHLDTSLNSIKEGLGEDLSTLKESHSILAKSSAENIDQIHSAMKNYTENANEFLDKYDESMTNAFRYLDTSLKNNLKQLDTNFAELNKTLKNINDNIKNGV